MSVLGYFITRCFKFTKETYCIVSNVNGIKFLGNTDISSGNQISLG